VSGSLDQRGWTGRFLSPEPISQGDVHRWHPATHWCLRSAKTSRSNGDLRNSIRTTVCDGRWSVSLPKSEVKRCALCGSTRNVQANHLGGRWHVAWITMAFCSECHSLFHAMVTRAGIDLSYTQDPIERIRRALAAIKIAEWMLLEQLKRITHTQGGKEL